jgi:hypothetical protein
VKIISVRGISKLPWPLHPNGYTLVWIMITILILFGVWVWVHYADGQAVYLQVMMRSSVDGEAAVYYDLGDGLMETNSVHLSIEKGSDFLDHRFRLPDAKIHSLRFDPLTTEGHVEIQSIHIIDGFGNSREDIALSRLKPSHQIAQFDRTNQRVSLDMEAGAYDPQLVITFPNPVRYDRIHPAFYSHMGAELLAIAMAVIVLTLWAAWEDRKQVRKWISRFVIAGTLVMVLFFLVQTCLAIWEGSILPAMGWDTKVFLFMAAQKWTSPNFYHGLRPWTAPALHSLFNGAQNTRNLILLQMIISCAAWICLAFSASRLLKDDLLKALAFMAIACIPLNVFMNGYWNIVILSESYSFSFLAFFLAVYFWYFRTDSWASVLTLIATALLFAFTRDTDAYRVLFMALPVLWTFIRQLGGRTGGKLRHAVLFASFFLIFIASDLSSSNIHHDDVRDTPFTNARWYFPMLDNMGSRILENEEMVQFFADLGLPVTPALREMTGKWGSTDDWRWYNDPQLATQREWLYHHGRQTYAKYLLTHPVYTLQSAYHDRGVLIFPGGTLNAWYHEMAKPVNLRFLSPLFLNNEGDVRMFLVLFPFALIGIGFYWIRRRRDDTEAQIHQILLISYIILIAVPHAILVYHGDLMDLPRHQYTNIIQLNVSIMLFYLMTADWWLTAARRFLKSDSAKPADTQQRLRA